MDRTPARGMSEVQTLREEQDRETGQQAGDRHKSLTVMLVEDHAEFAAALAFMLRQYGYACMSRRRWNGHWPWRRASGWTW
ncbi:MAG TPA: hypothetical protein VH253_15205 [Phycisphaerae bacterium]|nr:hypothetical protein [Phycisphaerae bacterium]